MSGSLTRVGGENVPGIPGACVTHNVTYLARGPYGIVFTVNLASSNPKASVHSISHNSNRCAVFTITKLRKSKMNILFFEFEMRMFYSTGISVWYIATPPCQSVWRSNELLPSKPVLIDRYIFEYSITLNKNKPWCKHNKQRISSLTASSPGSTFSSGTLSQPA